MRRQIENEIWKLLALWFGFLPDGKVEKGEFGLDCWIVFKFSVELSLTEKENHDLILR